MEAALSNIDDLKGEALDSALEAVGLLEGNKARSADEKRALLRDREQQVASEGTVQVAVAYPYDRHETNIDGIGVLTRDPTPVSRDQLDAVKAGAESAGVKLSVGR